MRIELFMTVLAGFAGGLFGTLWAGLVSSPLYAWRPQWRPESWQPESATRLLAGAALHGACGAASGALFWLGWGLIALVSTPWPVLGVAYGTLVWTAAAAPAYGALALRTRRGRAALLVLALESLVAAVASGLLCAYVWQRAT